MLDEIISYRLRYSNDRKFKQWSDIYFNKLDNDVVINGSSRAWLQYNPAILDSILGINSYNLGFDGSHINRQIVKYNTYCRVQNHRPTCLIQNIDYATISLVNNYEREQFFPYFHFDKQLLKEIDKYENFNFFEKHIPCYRYSGYQDVIWDALGLLPTKNILYKGYHGFDRNWNGKEFNKQDFIKYSENPEDLVLFENFIKDITSSGTKVIFVYAPIYIGATNIIVNIKGMYEMYDTIAKKYNIPILDYNYDSICYDTNYFYNATHLNKKGSELFSIKLAHDIDSLGILK